MPPEELDQNTGVKPAEGEQSTQQSTLAAPAEAPKPAEGATTTEGQTTETKVEAKVEDKPKSSLDAVMKALAKPEPAAEAPKLEPAAAATAIQDKKAAGEGEKDFIPEAEYRKLTPVVRQRISNLTEQRNTARDQVRDMAPRAKTSDDIVAYCQKNRVSPDDFQFGLHMMALVRNDPNKAWEALQPLVKDLQAHVGEILPADLTKEVEAGTISEARARELAAARRESARLAETRKVEGEERTRSEASRTYDENVKKNTDSVRTWEESWKAKDPDYEKKRERVWERLMVLINDAVEQRKPLTPELSVQLAEKAKGDVEKWLSELMPKPREIRPGPGSTGGGSAASSSTGKQPSSALEAARLALRPG